MDEGSATEVHWLNRPENDFFSRDRFLKIIHPVRKVRHVPQFPSTDVGSIGFSFFLKPDVLKTPGMNSSVGHPSFQRFNPKLSLNRFRGENPQYDRIRSLLLSFSLYETPGRHPRPGGTYPMRAPPESDER